MSHNFCSLLRLEAYNAYRLINVVVVVVVVV